MDPTSCLKMEVLGRRLMGGGGEGSTEREYSQIAGSGVGEQDGGPSGPREARQGKWG